MMPTSPAGKTREAQSGFTLVEVLAVLFIIGMMAAPVIMNMPKTQDPLHKQGELLATRISLAAQSGLVAQQSVGIILQEDGYEIVRYNNEIWETAAIFSFGLDSKPFLELRQNATKINLETAEKSGVPAIRYDSTGLGTPFELKLQNANSRYLIIGNVDGTITVRPARE